jgi:hypothetical protein
MGKSISKSRAVKIVAHLKILKDIENELLAQDTTPDSAASRRGDIGRILSIKDSVVVIEG